ncbi:MAG: tetratricopeptide repeat protein [Polyangiaceae bacterium]
MRRVALISVTCALGISLLAMGCSKHPKSADTPVPSASASQQQVPHGAPKPSASGAPKGLPNGARGPTESEREALASDAEDQRFEREVLTARQLMSKKDYAKAIEHFTSALSSGREDARCLGERGYARWLLKDKSAAKSDFWEAAGASPEPDVAGQIWYNLGLVYEDDGDAEMSRAAFAMSYAMGHSKAAKTKLGGRSACRSMIVRGPAAADELTAAVVKGWLGVHRYFSLEGTPKSEADAKNMVCHTVSRAMGGPPENPEGACTGPSPWELSCCAKMGGFLFQQMFVVEGKGGSFFTYRAGEVGGWPRECLGHAGPTLKIQGDLVIATTVGSDMRPNYDYLSVHQNVESSDPPCRQSPDQNIVEVFSLTTGKRLLWVRSYSTSTPPAVTVNDAGTEATVRGNDCDETIRL